MKGLDSSRNCSTAAVSRSSSISDIGALLSLVAEPLGQLGPRPVQGGLHGALRDALLAGDVLDRQVGDEVQDEDPPLRRAELREGLHEGHAFRARPRDVVFTLAAEEVRAYAQAPPAAGGEVPGDVA